MKREKRKREREREHSANAQLKKTSDDLAFFSLSHHHPLGPLMRALSPISKYIL